MKGYKTMTFNAALILASVLAFLNQQDLPAVVIAALRLFGIEATPEAVSSVIFVVIGLVGLVLRLVTDSPVPSFKARG